MAGSIESVRTTVGSQSVVSPVGVEVTSNQRRGHYRGEQVRSTQDESKLSRASADTRTGSTASSRVDLRTAQIRLQRRGQGTNSQATSRIAEYRDKLPDMPSEQKLQNLAKEFEGLAELLAEQPQIEARGQGERPQAELETGPEDNRPEDPSEEGEARGGDRPTGPRASVQETRQRILSTLQQFDDDVSHQFAALDVLSGQFEETGAPSEFLEALDLARQSFEEPGIAADVRAGLAAGRIAHERAATLETDPGLVRDGYRALLKERSDLGGLFDQLARFDLSGKFHGVIDTFLAIAGRDLETVDGSTDPAFLHGLIRELSKLKTMNTVFGQSRDLVAILERMIPQGERGRVRPEQLTSSLLHFVATNGATPRDARQIMRGLEDLVAQTRVLLGNGIKDLHAAVPDDVFPSFQARSQQKSALMGFLDDLVEEEERENEAN